MSRVEILTWDWKEQVDFDDLARVVKDLSGGKVHVTFVDTESDQFALAFSDGPITHDEAKDAYDRRWEDDE